MKNVLLVLSLLAFCGCAKVVEQGQAGVKFDFGKVTNEVLVSGWHWFNPMFTDIEVWNVKTQELKETAKVPSSEGLISELDVSVIWRIPQDKVVQVRTTIGRDVVGVILEPNVREVIREVVSGYQVKSLYSEDGRVLMTKDMLSKLKAKVADRGLLIEDVLLRDVRLPQTFSDSINTKLKVEQESLQKEFELSKAKKDAEIAVAHANGVAESNKIIAGSITENYIRWLFIDGLKDNKEKMIIYVPTEANLPILEAGRAK